MLGTQNWGSYNISIIISIKIIPASIPINNANIRRNVSLAFEDKNHLPIHNRILDSPLSIFLILFNKESKEGNKDILYFLYI